MTRDEIPISTDDQAAYLVRSAEWWSRLSPEQRARYEALYDEPPPDDGPDDAA